MTTRTTCIHPAWFSWEKWCAAIRHEINMKKTRHQKLTCGRCNEPVRQRDTFCVTCGGLFADGLCCVKHKTKHADGVCVICSQPFCNTCGADVNKIFLCNVHADYEITEKMARVFGCTDYVRTQFAMTCLKQAGYHPFLYSRLFNPTADKVAISALRNFGNHPIAEQKVLVPFPEVLNAVKELKKHKFKEIWWTGLLRSLPSSVSIPFKE